MHPENATFYYHHGASGESTWNHPLEGYYRGLVGQLRSYTQKLRKLRLALRKMADTAMETGLPSKPGHDTRGQLAATKAAVAHVLREHRLKLDALMAGEEPEQLAARAHRFRVGGQAVRAVLLLESLAELRPEVAAELGAAGHSVQELSAELLSKVRPEDSLAAEGALLAKELQMLLRPPWGVALHAAGAGGALLHHLASLRAKPVAEAAARAAEAEAVAADVAAQIVATATAEAQETAAAAESTAQTEACAAVAAGLHGAAEEMAAWAKASVTVGQAANPATLQRPQPPLRPLRKAAAGMRTLTAGLQPDEAAVAAFAAVCYFAIPSLSATVHTFEIWHCASAVCIL